MENIKIDSSIREVNDLNLVDLYCKNEEIVNRLWKEETVIYEYTVFFRSEKNTGTLLADNAIQAMKVSNAILATQLYDEIKENCKDTGKFETISVEVNIKLSNLTVYRSFVYYEKGELQIVEYTNGYIGLREDHGFWSFSRDGKWSFTKDNYSIKFDGKEMRYSFTSEPSKMRFPINQIENNVYGCLTEAKRMMIYYFNIVI